MLTVQTLECLSVQAKMNHTIQYSFLYWKRHQSLLPQNKCIISTECFSIMEILNFPRNADKKYQDLHCPSSVSFRILVLDNGPGSDETTLCLNQGARLPSSLPLLYTDLFVRGSERTGRGPVLCHTYPHTTYPGHPQGGAGGGQCSSSTCAVAKI